jgi:hypothetical protein
MVSSTCRGNSTLRLRGSFLDRGIQDRGFIEARAVNAGIFWN